jgi:hypothetical protein
LLRRGKGRKDVNAKVNQWNERQQLLKAKLVQDQDYPQGVALFLVQHGEMHSLRPDTGLEWSYQDEVCAGLRDESLRIVPPGQLHSIAWCLWHTARIEDIVMNMLIGDRPQIFIADDWQAKMQISFKDTGNLTSPEDVSRLSREIDLPALRFYRREVAERTRRAAVEVRPDQWQTKVPPERLEAVLQTGSVSEKTRDLLRFWGGLTIAGLLLMPPTQHQMMHLVEAQEIRNLLS